MTSYKQPFLCAFCLHLLDGHVTKEGILIQNCKAFPMGIPEKFFLPENAHLSPINGDNGIVFEHNKRTKIPESLEWVLK